MSTRMSVEAEAVLIWRFISYSLTQYEVFLKIGILSVRRAQIVVSADKRGTTKGTLHSTNKSPVSMGMGERKSVNSYDK